MLAHLCSQRWLSQGDVSGGTAGKIREKHENLNETNNNSDISKFKENSSIDDIDQSSTKLPNKLKPKLLLHQMKKLALKTTDKHNTAAIKPQSPPDVINCAIRPNSPSTKTAKPKQPKLDFDQYLTEASLEEPANIPMVISRDVVLRATGIFTKDLVLAMGNVVNGVHKTDEWLFVQTSNGTEGYIPYSSCIPLGVKPSLRINDNPLAWEINSKRTSSNKTDTEKLFHFSDTFLKEEKEVEKTVVVCNYRCKNKDQVSVRRDETVKVIDQSCDDWLRVETIDGKVGLIPTAYTTLGKQYFV